MPWVDNSLDKLKSLASQDPGRPVDKQSLTLYEFKCPQCGYHKNHARKELTCGCGAHLIGKLVFQKILGQVVYDNRSKYRY